jgi:predicted metal-binding membrane protein
MRAQAALRRDHVPTVIAAAVAAAWAAAIGARATGHASALDHDALIEGSLPVAVTLLMFLAAWQLVITAMMLPSAWPMIRLFAKSAAAHADAGRAKAAFVAGYITVWTAFGAVALVGDVGVHRVVDATPGLTDRPWLVAGALLIVAGVSQFLPLTRACLRSCRHPVAYLMQHFRPGTRAAYDVGRGHGLYCLGCCWGLMLVMFAAGVANLVWMAGLTAVMAYQKVGRRGTQLASLVGAVLIAWGAAVVVHAGWLPHALAGVD